MKTKAEILETIEETKYRLTKMEKPTSYYDEMYDSHLAEMDGWINALEWVLDDSFDFPQTYPLDPEEDKHLYAPEEAFQEDLSPNDGEPSEESQVQRYLRLSS